MVVNHGSLTAEDIRKLQVFEHKCWRSCLNISYRDRIRNEQVRTRFDNQLNYRFLLRSLRKNYDGSVTC